MKQATKAEILAADFVQIGAEHSPTGIAFVLVMENGEAQATPLIASNGVHPRYYNLLSASRVMFGALDEQGVHLQRLLDMCDALNIERDSDLPKALESMQNAVLLAQQCATDGLDTVARRVLQTGNN